MDCLVNIIFSKFNYFIGRCFSESQAYQYDSEIEGPYKHVVYNIQCFFISNCYIRTPKYSSSTFSHKNLLIFNNFLISKQWSIEICINIITMCKPNNY